MGQKLDCDSRMIHKGRVVAVEGGWKLGEGIGKNISNGLQKFQQ